MNGKTTLYGPLRIGTRGSPLALIQAHQIAESIQEYSNGNVKTEIVTFTTTGDKLTTQRLINSGGKGLFTKELDRALDEDEIDIAVHSLKDVPTQLPHDQEFVCFPKREDPREGFLSRIAKHPDELPEGAKLGTASLRREAQTLAMRPDLEIVTFRGSVETRMRKLDEGLADATYLAMAGLARLGLADVATPIPLTDMLPSAAQGIIGVVARNGLKPEWLNALRRANDAAAEAAATAERAVLRELDGSCRTAIGAHLFQSDLNYRLIGEVLMPDGSKTWREDVILGANASLKELDRAGRELGSAIRRAAGGDLPAFEDSE